MTNLIGKTTNVFLWFYMDIILCAVTKYARNDFINEQCNNFLNFVIYYTPR